MDFGIDDELDYEEDLPVSDSLKDNSESEKCSEGGMKKNINLLRCEEDYLQINCPEEEENLASGERPSETAAEEITAEEVAEAQGDEEKEETKKQRVLVGKEQCTQTNPVTDCEKGNGAGKRNRNKKTKRARSCPRRPAKRRTLGKSRTGLNPWLPECSFSYEPMEASAAAFYSNQVLLSHRDWRPSGKAILPLRTFDVVQRGRAPPRKTSASSNSLKVRASARLLHEDVSQCKTDYDAVNFGRNFGREVSSKAEKSKKSSSVEKKIDVILRRDQEEVEEEEESTRSCYGNGWHLQNGSGVRLEKFGGKFEAGSPISFLGAFKKNAAKLNALKDDEKELVQRKKEARLQRFMQDVVIKTEKKPFELSVDKKPDGRLPGPEDYWGERKVKEEKHPQRDSDDIQGPSLLKKELLLRKRNPFEANAEVTDHVAGVRIKQEVRWEENLEAGKVENGGSEVFGGAALFALKKGADSHVRFVRTITKSLDELGFGRVKGGGIPDRSDEPPSAAFRPFPFMEELMEEQMRPQLTGCVVKVLNVPPSTTTNDVLSLCSRIGIVKEVKLNFPKENSVVIRFAEPTSAENFFSLYHGQKMNNYFLNVIVI